MFISWNGPLVYKTMELLKTSLNRHFIAEIIILLDFLQEIDPRSTKHQKWLIPSTKTVEDCSFKTIYYNTKQTLYLLVQNLFVKIFFKQLAIYQKSNKTNTVFISQKLVC